MQATAGVWDGTASTGGGSSQYGGGKGGRSRGGAHDPMTVVPAGLAGTTCKGTRFGQDRDRSATRPPVHDPAGKRVERERDSYADYHAGSRLTEVALLVGRRAPIRSTGSPSASCLSWRSWTTPDEDHLVRRHARRCPQKYRSVSVGSRCVTWWRAQRAVAARYGVDHLARAERCSGSSALEGVRNNPARRRARVAVSGFFRMPMPSAETLPWWRRTSLKHVGVGPCVFARKSSFAIASGFITLTEEAVADAPEEAGAPVVGSARPAALQLAGRTYGARRGGASMSVRGVRRRERLEMPRGAPRARRPASRDMVPSTRGRSEELLRPTTRARRGR